MTVKTATRCLVLLPVMTFCGNPSPAAQNDRLIVKADARPRNVYVGQVVDLTVTVRTQGEVPKLTTPRVEHAVVLAGMTGTGREADSPGGLATTHFQIVPKRAGTLTIPAVEARLAGKVGRSSPVRVNVSRVPSAGRPSTFLGGVGPFEVAAKVEPATVRAGGSVEYRVVVGGPGALGMSTAPILGRLPGGIEVESLPITVVGEPPSRVFAWRLRPTRPRETLLPPVSVAVFDPGSGRFLTKATSAVRLSVLDVPRLDPSALAYGPPAPVERRRGVSREVSAVAALFSMLVGGLVAWVVWRRRGPNLGRELRRSLARIEAAGDGPEMGRAITEGLVDYLKRTVDRPGGALTPQEAEEGIARATGSDGLADEARRLIELCDQAQFGTGEASRDVLRDLGRRFFRGLLGRPREKQ